MLEMPKATVTERQSNVQVNIWQYSNQGTNYVHTVQKGTQDSFQSY